MLLVPNPNNIVFVTNLNVPKTVTPSIFLLLFKRYYYYYYSVIYEGYKTGNYYTNHQNHHHNLVRPVVIMTSLSPSLFQDVLLWRAIFCPGQIMIEYPAVNGFFFLYINWFVIRYFGAMTKIIRDTIVNSINRINCVSALIIIYNNRC